MEGKGSTNFFWTLFGQGRINRERKKSEKDKFS